MENRGRREAFVVIRANALGLMNWHGIFVHGLANSLENDTSMLT